MLATSLRHLQEARVKSPSFLADALSERDKNTPDWQDKESQRERCTVVFISKRVATVLRGEIQNISLHTL